MIQEQMMKTGGWSLKFNQDSTPYEIRRRMKFFSNIIITPSYAGPGAIQDFPALKAQSIYSGLLTRRALRRGTISGVGLLGYLANGKGSAGIWHSSYTGVTLPATFAQLLTYWFSGPSVEYANGLRMGTAYSPTAATVSSLSQATLPDMKQAIDVAAQQTLNEYRVTPAGLIDYGASVYTTKNILISPDIRTGTTGDWQFWCPSEWDPESNVEDYRNTGRVLTADKLSSGFGAVSWGTPGTVPMMRTWNNSYDYTAVWTNSAEKVISGNVVSDATAVAVAIANNHASPEYDLSCKVNITAPTRFLVPGDYVHIYDALEGIVGTSHTDAPGQDIAALVQRCYGISWPVEEGMGVYLVDGIYNISPYVPAVTDLTPYVQWETGPSSLELGPPVSPTQDSNLVD